MPSKLLLFRLYHKWNANHVARKLKISPSKYRLLEMENAVISKGVAQKLGNLYKVPSQIFSIKINRNSLQLKYSGCTFWGGNNGYINCICKENDRQITNLIERIDIGFIKLQEEIITLKKEIGNIKSTGNCHY